MRKIYEKPTVMLEKFDLEEQIAEFETYTGSAPDVYDGTETDTETVETWG